VVLKLLVRRPGSEYDWTSDLSVVELRTKARRPEWAFEVMEHP
jgi:hypothetical protein